MKHRCLIAVPFLLASCAIKDDIPYPIVEAAITAFEVQGQCDAKDKGFAAAEINKNESTVDVYVSDTVSLSSVRILKMELTHADLTVIQPDTAVCLYPDRFPRKSFSRPASTENTWADFSRGAATFTLHTYQDYTWRIRVHPVVLREVQMSGQVGDAVIDPVNRNVIVYVNGHQDLAAITVQAFKPAGQHCIVSPDPTESKTYDFSQMCTFSVTPGNSNISETWQVFVYHTEAEQTISASVFPRSTDAIISGQCLSGGEPCVQYRRLGDTDWQQLPLGQITVNGSRYEAWIPGLVAGGTYEYTVSYGNLETAVQSFTTVAPQQLENGSFDEWSTKVREDNNRILYQPWAEGSQPYWDTGNHGATTVGASNSTFVDEDGRRFANLQSKYIVIKFAAGNIFTGEYIETDGSNGVLSFGRPFTSFPTAMRFDFKYHTSTITKMAPGGWHDAYGTYITRELFEGMKGQPDSCNVYIALGDWEPETYTISSGSQKGQTKEVPYLIRTRPSALHLMDMHSPHLIAFAQMTCGKDVNTWTTETLYLNYIVRDRQPKYIIVVASSSKYGDYFTGGEESLLQLDNLELLYE